MLSIRAGFAAADRQRRAVLWRITRRLGPMSRITNIDAEASRHKSSRTRAAKRITATATALL
jgi:hypothetical protein